MVTFLGQGEKLKQHSWCWVCHCSTSKRGGVGAEAGQRTELSGKAISQPRDVLENNRAGLLKSTVKIEKFSENVSSVSWWIVFGFGETLPTPTHCFFHRG